MFYDDNKEDWSPEGVTTVATTTGLKCGASHNTSFALILVSILAIFKHLLSL